MERVYLREGDYLKVRQYMVVKVTGRGEEKNVTKINIQFLSHIVASLIDELI